MAGVLIAALGLTAGAALHGAQGASVPPTLAEAAPDSMTSSFNAGGVAVIVRRNPANDVVAANLYLLGGSRQVTAATAGIETVLLAASERGTRRYPREVLNRKMARLGSRITIEAERDWTMLSMEAIRSTFDSTWAIFADRIVAPTLDTADVEAVRAQALAAARSMRSSPDALVSYLADSLEFAGHPYAFPPTGSERSLSELTAQELHRYHDTQFVTSRMLLVVVGNVDPAHVRHLVETTLATLPRGSYRWSAPPDPPEQQAALLEVARTLPTNYMLGYYAGPRPSSPDYQALRIATAVLSGRLFNEIRVRRNLTYAVGAPFVEGAIATGGLYVTTVQPETTLALMRMEVEQLKTQMIDGEALPSVVQQFITRYFLDNETNAQQASFLARAALYRGDYHAAGRFVEELRAVTPEDLRRVAREYMHDLRFVYVGDTARLHGPLPPF